MEFVVLDLGRGDLTAQNLVALEAEGYRRVDPAGLLVFRRTARLASGAEPGGADAFAALAGMAAGRPRQHEEGA